MPPDTILILIAFIQEELATPVAAIPKGEKTEPQAGGFFISSI